MNIRDAYELLGVPYGGSAAEAKKAFRAKALKLHPDHGGDAKLFAELKEAFEEAMKHAPYITPHPVKTPAGTRDTAGKYDPFLDPDYARYQFFEPETDSIASFERSVVAKGCKHCNGRGIITKLVEPEKGFLGRQDRFCICQKID